MAKNKKPVNVQQAKPVAKAAPVSPEPGVIIKPWSLYDFKLQAIIVALLGFIFYVNTYSNEYAHDDEHVQDVRIVQPERQRGEQQQPGSSCQTGARERFHPMRSFCANRPVGLNTRIAMISRKPIASR